MYDKPLVLAGFMGVGKSTVARELAAHVDCSYCDLDNWISDHSGMSPSDYILKRGEIAFRRLELSSLEAVLMNPPPIIALGGGTLHINGCKELLEACCVIVLECRFDVIMDRIQNSNRPLAKHAEILYEQRSKDYLLYSNRINVTELTVDGIIKKILMLWALNENN